MVRTQLRFVVGAVSWRQGNPLFRRNDGDNEEHGFGTVSDQSHLISPHPNTNCAFRWVPGLPDLFAKHGMVDTRKELHPCSPHSRIYWSQLQFNSNAEYSFLAMDNSTPDSAGPRLRNLTDKAAEECRQGAGFDFTIEVAIGRKPE